MEESKQIKLNEVKWDRRSLTYDLKRFDYMRYMQKKAIAQLDYKGHFVGIDISGGMIDKANENVKGHNNISFIKGSTENLPFDNDYFDDIICTNSFHHFLNPEQVIGEVQRVLKVNGRICILDITADDFFIRWINQKVREKEKEHVNFYNTIFYKDLFQKHGLKHIRSKRIRYPIKVHIAEKIDNV